MLKIALIDDQDYGLDQIVFSHMWEECQLSYFASFAEFKKSRRKFDIVYLDYYLEKDGTTAPNILSFVKEQTKRVIAFSSVPRCNKELLELGADEAAKKEKR